MVEHNAVSPIPIIVPREIIGAYIIGNEMFPQTQVAIGFFMADAIARNISKFDLVSMFYGEMDQSQKDLVYRVMNRKHRDHAIPKEYDADSEFNGRKVTDESLHRVWTYVKNNALESLVELGRSSQTISEKLSGHAGLGYNIMQGDSSAIEEELREFQQCLLDDPDLLIEVKNLAGSVKRGLVGYECLELSKEFTDKLNKVYLQLKVKPYREVRKEADNIVYEYSMRVLRLVRDTLKLKYPENDWTNYGKDMIEI